MGIGTLSVSISEELVAFHIRSLSRQIWVRLSGAQPETSPKRLYAELWAVLPEGFLMYGGSKSLA